MKSKKNRGLMAYVCMPLAFALVGMVLFWVGFQPVVSDFEMQLNRLFNSGDTFYAAQLDKVIDPDAAGLGAIETEESTDEPLQVVEEPNIGDQYGILSCESLGIYTPVYFGDNSDVLNCGVGTYPASWIPGCGHTTLLSGHNNMAFNSLQNVQIGDEFTLTTDYGEYTYRVSEFTIVDETELEACRLDDETEQVVMYTCYPFYRISGRRTQRFFVYLEKISGPEIELTNYFLKD